MTEETKELLKLFGVICTPIVTFFVGKSGIVKRYFDNRLSKVERQQKREESEVGKTKLENEQLHRLVDDLTQKVSHLEKELATTNLKLKLLLAYFEKTQPDADSFIENLKRTSEQ